MKVKVVPAIYGGVRVHEIEVDENESAKSVKERICKFEMIPSFAAYLFFKEKVLDENMTLQNLGIKEGDELQLIIIGS